LVGAWPALDPGVWRCGGGGGGGVGVLVGGGVGPC